MSTFMGYSTGYDPIYCPSQPARSLCVSDSWRPSQLNGKAEYYNPNTTGVGPYQYVVPRQESTSELCTPGTSKDVVSVKGEVLLHRGNVNSSKYNAYETSLQPGQDSPKIGFPSVKCFDNQQLPAVDPSESDITESNQPLNMAHQMVQRTVSCQDADVTGVDSQSQQSYSRRHTVADQAKPNQSNIIQRSPGAGLHCRKSEETESEIFSRNHVTSPRYTVQGGENDTSPYRITRSSKSPYSFHTRVQGSTSTSPMSSNSLSIPSESNSLFVSAGYRNPAGETSGSKADFSHGHGSEDISSHPAESSMIYPGQPTSSREKYLSRHQSYHIGQGEQEASTEFTAATSYEKRHEESRLTANPFHGGYESQGIGM